MAAKHDGKKARANFWVMQQNVAKQKGQAFWMQKPRHTKLTKDAAPAPAAPAPRAPDAPTLE